MLALTAADTATSAHPSHAAATSYGTGLNASPASAPTRAARATGAPRPNLEGRFSLTRSAHEPGLRSGCASKGCVHGRAARGWTTRRRGRRADPSVRTARHGHAHVDRGVAALPG